MRSVADGLRLETSDAVAKLSIPQRIELALRLGDEDVARYQSAHDVDEANARRALSRARATGRLTSRSNDCDVL